MTHTVAESCVNCKYIDCVEVCPVDAFREGQNCLVIDPKECIDCTLCVAQCPVNAIFMDSDLPPQCPNSALDLLGIQVEVTRVGAFKGAVEPYMLPAMSDHLRAHYEAMLRSMNDDVVRCIATGRKLSPDKVREMQAQRLFTAKEAKQNGLIDELVQWSGVERAIAKVRGDEQFELASAEPKKQKQSRDLMTLISSLLRQKKDEEIEDPQLVVLHLSGSIVDGDKPAPGSMVSGVAAKKIDELADNELVKGVVVRINSPGGSATASEAIRLALQRLAVKKPVVFSMGDLAASGGYWITTIGRPLLAEVGTITGS
ncbi:MAG: S49 family peptidase, partial [Planctomycetota bacterium]